MSTTSKPTVFLIDDDKSIRDSLKVLMKSTGIPLVGFTSAEEFLEDLPEKPVGCVLVDVLLPNMGGMELMQELENRTIILPVILLTAHADVPLAIQAIRSGAFDVIEKPYKDKILVERVRQAMSLSPKWRDVQAERVVIAEKMAELTRREKEVMKLIVTGMKNKAIAEELGISRKTLDIHRSKVMGKMKARTIADLVNWAYLDNPAMLRTTGPVTKQLTNSK
jgi:two-component system, LuxR family, response regulator FixJ